jgi:CheY-like chemotaxis protein
VATIPIVEDQAQVLVLAQSLLEEQGHRTLSAAIPDDALAILTGQETVDALFVDIILNGNMQAGIELAKRAVELKASLKVVYSTGLPVTDDLKALLVPGSVILEKPYDQLLTSLSVHVAAGPQPHVWVGSHDAATAALGTGKSRFSAALLEKVDAEQGAARSGVSGLYPLLLLL